MRIILSILYILIPFIALYICFNQKYKKYRDSMYWGCSFLTVFLWVKTFSYIAQIEDFWKSISIAGMFIFMIYELAFLITDIINNKKE